MPDEKYRTQRDWLDELHANNKKPAPIKAGDRESVNPRKHPDWTKRIATVIEVDPADPMNMYQTPDGQTILRGLTLRQAREILGGDRGSYADPITGMTSEISLERWAGADPDTTYVRIISAAMTQHMDLEST